MGAPAQWQRPGARRAADRPRAAGALREQVGIQKKLGVSIEDHRARSLYWRADVCGIKASLRRSLHLCRLGHVVRDRIGCGRRAKTR